MRAVSTGAALFAAVCAILSASCQRATSSSASSSSPAPALVERAGLAMGSDLRLSAWTDDRPRTEAGFDAVFAEFDRLDGLLSVWREGSDIVRLNAAAGEHPVAIGRDTLDVLQKAREISELTGGKFDVTFGALSGLWKFDQDQDDTVPDRADVQRRLPLIDFKSLEIDRHAGTAFLKRRGMRTHLGGIGKGYAVERSVAILRAHGLRDFMIQAGGDLYVGGRRGDRPWRLGVNDPRGKPGQSFGTIELTDSTFSTSGDYERFFFKDGVRYHHIIDPDTGEPARGCRSVTIVAGSPLLADGLSTGVFLLGPQAGMALVERLPDVEAVIVSDRNEVLVSSGLKGRFHQTAPPTDAP